MCRAAGSRVRLLHLPPGADEREILMKRKQLTDTRDRWSWKLGMKLRGGKGQMRGKSCTVLIKHSRRWLTSCNLFGPLSLETSAESRKQQQQQQHFLNKTSLRTKMKENSSNTQILKPVSFKFLCFGSSTVFESHFKKVSGSHCGALALN